MAGPQTATAPDTSEDLNDLASLGAALQQAAGKAKDEAKIKDAILDKIATLDADTAKSLMKDARIQNLIERISFEQAQASDDPPGTIRSGWIGNAEVKGFTKKEWTETDLRRDREERPGGAGTFVTFTPTETIPVFYQGLRRQLIAEEEITIEKCFKDIYDQHRRAAKIAAEHVAYMFNKRNTLSDPGIVTAETARVRGMSEPALTHFVPGGGSIIALEAPKTAASDEENTPSGTDEEA